MGSHLFQNTIKHRMAKTSWICQRVQLGFTLKSLHQLKISSIQKTYKLKRYYLLSPSMRLFPNSSKERRRKSTQSFRIKRALIMRSFARKRIRQRNSMRLFRMSLKQKRYRFQPFIDKKLHLLQLGNETLVEFPWSQSHLE